MWGIETINDYHCLFVRVHESLINKKENTPSASAFTNSPKKADNLSSDWCKYSTSENTRQFVAKLKHPKGGYRNPSDYYIWRFSIIALIKLYIYQRIEHDPVYNSPEIDENPNNRAHTKIIGDKPDNQAEFRIQIKRAGSWAIPPSF